LGAIAPYGTFGTMFHSHSITRKVHVNRQTRPNELLYSTTHLNVYVADRAIIGYRDSEDCSGSKIRFGSLHSKANFQLLRVALAIDAERLEITSLNAPASHRRICTTTQDTNAAHAAGPMHAKDVDYHRRRVNEFNEPPGPTQRRLHWGRSCLRNSQAIWILRTGAGAGRKALVAAISKRVENPHADSSDNRNQQHGLEHALEQTPEADEAVIEVQRSSDMQSP